MEKLDLNKDGEISQDELFRVLQGVDVASNMNRYNVTNLSVE